MMTAMIYDSDEKRHSSRAYNNILSNANNLNYSLHTSLTLLSYSEIWPDLFPKQIFKCIRLCVCSVYKIYVYKIP